MQCIVSNNVTPDAGSQVSLWQWWRVLIGVWYEPHVCKPEEMSRERKAYGYDERATDHRPYRERFSDPSFPNVNSHKSSGIYSVKIV